jgi:hypothetical protein
MTDHELETTREEHPSVDSIAGLLATGAIVLGIIALAYRPARMGPVAILIALVAATMSLRWRKLAAVAMAVAILGWFVGMTIAVLTEHPLF